MESGKQRLDSDDDGLGTDRGVSAGGSAKLAARLKRVITWTWIALCVAGYAFCFHILVKVFGYGTNYDDGFSVQLHNFQRGVAYVGVMGLAVGLMLVTGFMWAWMDKRAWTVLMIAGLVVLGWAQRIESVNYGKSAPEFLRGFGDRLKSEKIDFAAIRAWAATPKESRAQTIPDLAKVQGVCSNYNFSMDGNSEVPDSVVFRWGGTWGMWGILVCPVDVKHPAIPVPMNEVREVEPGVFVCFGSD